MWRHNCRSQLRRMCWIWDRWKCQRSRRRKRETNHKVREEQLFTPQHDCKHEKLHSPCESFRRRCIPVIRRNVSPHQPLGHRGAFVKPFLPLPSIRASSRPAGLEDAPLTAQTNKLFHCGGVCAHICLVLTKNDQPRGFLHLGPHTPPSLRHIA